jgi:AcrR family transcriptional regulator
MAAEGNKKNTTQARGRVRRQLLCRAAAELLESYDLDAISLGDVAALADVPKGSAYHFYTNIYDLYLDLVAEVGAELAEKIVLPADSIFTSWQDVVAASLTHGVAFLNATAAGRQLVLGPKSPPQIKLSDRRNDYRLGTVLRHEIERFFVLPELPRMDEYLFYAIELADVLFCLSVADHGKVVDAIRDEGIKAAVAYLGLYLPPSLPRRYEP